MFRTPGYPVLLAPLFWIKGANPPVLWARVEAALLGTVAAGGVGWLSWRLFGSRAGWVGMTLSAFYPGAIATGALVLSEAPFGPAMLAHLALWIKAWKAPSPKATGGWALAAGVAAGVATLIRPSWLLFLPFGALAGLLLADGRKRQLGIAATMGLGLVVVMTPWWVRGVRLTGHFVPTTLQVGASLYDGLGPQATGASDMDFVSRFVQEERRREADPETLEYRLDRRMRDEALAWARAHPAEAVRLAGVKFCRMWNLWPNEPRFSSAVPRLVILLSYLPVVVLAIVGAVMTFRRGLPYMLCWLPAVYFTLLHMVFVSSLRYRQPAMLGLMVLAAGALAHASKNVPVKAREPNSSLRTPTNIHEES